MVTYRPEIDGLRAVAIISVILFHYKFSFLGGSHWAEGGFVGVDIFFVISGYLITHIILRELASESGFSIIKFYDRRVRRILPAILIASTAAFPTAWSF